MIILNILVIRAKVDNFKSYEHKLISSFCNILCFRICFRLFTKSGENGQLKYLMGIQCNLHGQLPQQQPAPYNSQFSISPKCSFTIYLTSP